MNVTLEGLETLEAIVRAGSFAAAARELHKAQSAISYTVRQLEERMGVEIFDRSGHRAVLTQAGHVILEEGRGLLAHARRLEELAQRIESGWEPRLALVIDGILPMEPIMYVLKQMAEEEVPTQIQIKVEFLGGVRFRFEKENADMMLVNEHVGSEGLVATPIGQVVSVLVTGADHPLASSLEHGSVTRAELQKYVELTVHDATESEAFRHTLFGGSRVYYLSDFSAKKKALEMGLGFGWAPLYLIEDALDSGELVELPYEEGSRRLYTPMLVYRSRRPPGRAGQRFLELLLEQ